MKTMIAAVVLLAAAPAFATDEFKQTVTSTTTSASSTVLAGPAGYKQYSVQCDVATRYRTGKTTVTATTDDLKLEADKVYDILVPPEHDKFAFVSVSGTSNCKLYLVYPMTIKPLS